MPAPPNRRHRLRTQRLRPMTPFVSSVTILLHKPYKVPAFHIVAAPHVGLASPQILNVVKKLGLRNIMFEKHNYLLLIRPGKRCHHQPCRHAEGMARAVRRN